MADKTIRPNTTFNIKGTWQINGTTVTATAAEINAIAGGGLSAAELAVLDGVTPGTVTASKALVADASKDLATLRHLTISGNLVTGATTLSEAELGVLDGVTAGTVAASKAVVVDANLDVASIRNLTLSGNQITSANVGTPGTNVTAVEYGDAYNHVTVLTLAAVELTPTIPANAEGAGAVIYTFPAGVYVANAAHMDITSGVMDTATNAADVGLGSLIASGDIATLTTAAMEDWITGQTVADVSTFVVEKSTIPTAGAPLVFEAAGSHTLNINCAATWNATVATASVTGTVTIYWTFLGA